MSSKNLHRYMKEYLKFQPKTLSYSQIEELIEYDAWLESPSGLTTRAADLPFAPACVICGKAIEEQGHIVVASQDNKLIVTAAYCAQHWKELGEIESAIR